MRRTGWAALALVLAAAGCTSQRTPTSTSSSRPSSIPSSTPSTTAPVPSPPPSPPVTGSTRPAPRVPPVSPAARRDGLVDVRLLVPDAIVDLRYATRDNFTRVRLYPRDARCLVHRSMAPGLRQAGRAAELAGLRLVFWDCYRPHAVQARMFRVVPNPQWVARPGPYAYSHESGRSVDVTLARGTRRIDMGTGFDEFSPRAYAFATAGVSATARRHRAVLRRVMGDLAGYDGEWWHFDGPGSDVRRPILQAPVG